MGRLRLKPEKVDLEPLLMIRFPGVYLWDLKYSAPCKSPRLHIFQKVSVPPDLIVETGIRETLFFSNLDVEGLSH